MNSLFSEFIAKVELQSKSIHTHEFHGFNHYVLLSGNIPTNIFIYNKYLLIENNIESDFLNFVETNFLSLVEIEVSDLDYNLKDFSERLKKNF